MTTFRRALLAAAVLTAASAAVLAPAALAGGGDLQHGEGPTGPRAVGLTADGALVGFRTTDPAAASVIGPVTGLAGDSALIGIDYRVQDGKLYGVGDEGGIYTIDDASGAAAKVRQLTVALDGASFGVDFNPAANALRVVSDTGQNLRQPFATPDAPTAVDTALTNPAVAPATGTTPARGTTAAGYTNNDLDAATATTLFDIDTVLDRVALQSPANAGTLAPTGNLPADIGPDAGLDILSTVVDGRAVGNDAFATVEVDGARRLWAVDVLSGRAKDLGQFGAPVTDLAVQLQR
jgi:hypothetical protein